MHIAIRSAAAAAVVALAACSSLPLGGAPAGRSLDYLRDDIGGLLIAFDLPQTLEPVPEGSVLSLDASTPASGERHLRARLVNADAGDLAGSLPPPADQRSYYLFAFSEPDRAAIREAQAWARTLPPGGGSLAVSLAPAFCRSAELDPQRVRVSVLVALPAPGLAPLIDNQPLAAVLAAAPGAALAPCAGHSG